MTRLLDSGSRFQHFLENMSSQNEAAIYCKTQTEPLLIQSPPKKIPLCPRRLTCENYMSELLALCFLVKFNPWGTPTEDQSKEWNETRIIMFLLLPVALATNYVPYPKVPDSANCSLAPSGLEIVMASTITSSINCFIPCHFPILWPYLCH